MNEPVIVTRIGHLVHIQLNRPTVLNALSLQMIQIIERALNSYVSDPEIFAFALTGVGGRAFCAGGDIKALSLEGRHDAEFAIRFWREEYALINRIARLEKPWVAIMDGITMGGGVGLAVHARHRVVTERTHWAMPECQIGFFPDVGLTRVFAKLSNGVGEFLGLTGQYLGAADLMHFGLADHFIQSERVAQLLDGLSVGLTLETALAPHFSDCGTGRFFHQRVALMTTFSDRTSNGDLLQILNRFYALEDVDFAHAKGNLRSSSPTSLEVTWALIKAAYQDHNLEQTLARELDTAQAALSWHDFHEGVRARLIDKDQRPIWRASSLTSLLPGK